MKRTLVFSSIAIGVAALAFSGCSPAQQPPQPETMMKADEAMMPTETAMMDDKMMAESRYVEYSNAAFEAAASDRRVLFFYASWCPTCQPADASFTQNASSIPEDMTLLRVNYNDPETDQDEKDLAKKYGVTYQHTFVQIDEDGNEVTKWNGGKIDELLSNIE